MKLGISHDEPPTIYALLNSYVNYGKDEKTKIVDLPKFGREMFFDFDYPLASGINKEDFEVMILNHFLMRRIGYETVTSFKIALNVKLNEIMPLYNKLFESIENWNIFNDGEIVNRNTIDNNTSSNSNSSINSNTSSGTTNTTSDRRFSDTPENKLTEVRDGEYISEYSYDQDSGTASNTSNTTSSNNGSSSSNTATSENITRTPGNKMELYTEFLKNRQNIYTMIFKDLDPLFYQII